MSEYTRMVQLNRMDEDPDRRYHCLVALPFPLAIVITNERLCGTVVVPSGRQLNIMSEQVCHE